MVYACHMTDALAPTHIGASASGDACAPDVYGGDHGRLASGTIVAVADLPGVRDGFVGTVDTDAFGYVYVWHGDACWRVAWCDVCPLVTVTGWGQA